MARLLIQFQPLNTATSVIEQAGYFSHFWPLTETYCIMYILGLKFNATACSNRKRCVMKSKKWAAIVKIAFRSYDLLLLFHFLHYIELFTYYLELQMPSLLLSIHCNALSLLRLFALKFILMHVSCRNIMYFITQCLVSHWVMYRGGKKMQS